MIVATPLLPDENLPCFERWLRYVLEQIFEILKLRIQKFTFQTGIQEAAEKLAGLGFPTILKFGRMYRSPPGCPGTESENIHPTRFILLRSPRNLQVPGIQSDSRV